MKARTVGYWVATGLTGFAFASGGIMDLMRGPEMVARMAHLGYPAYFMTILGAWKVLGAAAVLDDDEILEGAERWAREAPSPRRDAVRVGVRGKVDLDEAIEIGLDRPAKAKTRTGSDGRGSQGSCHRLRRFPTCRKLGPADPDLLRAMEC